MCIHHSQSKTSNGTFGEIWDKLFLRSKFFGCKYDANNHDNKSIKIQHRNAYEYAAGIQPTEKKLTNEWNCVLTIHVKYKVFVSWLSTLNQLGLVLWCRLHVFSFHVVAQRTITFEIRMEIVWHRTMSTRI